MSLEDIKREMVNRTTQSLIFNYQHYSGTLPWRWWNSGAREGLGMYSFFIALCPFPLPSFLAVVLALIYDSTVRTLSANN